MSEITNIALDAMGGDNAPAEMVKGAVDAAGKEPAMKVFLIGREEAVKRELAKYQYNKAQIEVIHASEVIETAEPPVNAIRKKKDSSIVTGMKMVREGRVRICGKFRRHSGGRPGSGGTHQGCGASAACVVDTDEEGGVPSA